jgi:hypothetical protein
MPEAPRLQRGAVASAARNPFVLVPGPGIEPGSCALQAHAKMTTLAHPAVFVVDADGFKPTT